MLLIFYFLTAWREPDPPIPSYGIELAFGLEDVGSGNEELSSEENTEDVQNEPAEEVEENIEAEEQPAENLEESSESDNIEEIPVTDEVSEPVEDVETSNATESTEAADASDNELTDESDKAEVQPEPEEEIIDESALMPSKSDSDNSNKGNTEEAGAQGKEEGNINGDAIMGEQGTAEGASLSITGWTWDSKPKPEDDSNESGKIVFRIKVDDYGEVINVEPVSSSVSFAVAKKYEQAVYRLTFSQTTSAPPAPVSEGTITFIIRSK